jgi:hypothetical protein
VFVDVLSRNGRTLLYGTYLGGGYQDQGDGIALDAGGGVHVTGYTGSAEFPVTPGAYQTTFGGLHRRVRDEAGPGRGAERLRVMARVR